jgi:hypothetical protein
MHHSSGSVRAGQPHRRGLLRHSKQSVEHVIVTIRLPSVEARLGASLGGVGEAAVRRLLGQPETEDLDFKRELYIAGPVGNGDLSTDVAAMANSGGGVIVLGLDEFGAGIAQAATHVLLSDQEELRMRSAVASAVAPMPQWTVLRVPDSGAAPDHGFYLLIVASSDQAPHAVRKNNNLKYPVRNGASTRYLTEHEVADAYRNRFDGARARVARLDELEAGVQLRGVPFSYMPWLTLALAPTTAARLRMSNAVISTVRQWLATTIQQMPYGTNFNNTAFEVDAGLRCFEIVDPAVRLGLPDVPRHTHRASAHLGLDGGAAVGLNLDHSSWS